jgi:HEPN domain-containing protein
MNTLENTLSQREKFTIMFKSSYENLKLLYEALVKNSSIRSGQYFNYLSQLALCIELGLKILISNKEDIDKTHNLKKLYDNTPDTFKQIFECKFSKQKIDDSLDKIKNMFEDCRYFEGNLDFFVPQETGILEHGGTIHILMAVKYENYQFVGNLLSSIIGYIHFIEENMNYGKYSPEKYNDKYSTVITDYFREATILQEKIRIG